MSKRIPIEELESYLWGSATLLRTNIDAGYFETESANVGLADAFK